MTKVWQIAAGEPRRYYDDIFVKHDVMFMGPGRHGSYKENSDKYDQLGNGLRRFVEAEDVQPGDCVLLRRGQRAKAIGTVADEGYAWQEYTFDDVFGWDLQHTRRVKWRGDLEEELGRVQAKSGFFASKRGRTFSAVNSTTVRERLEPLLSRCRERPLKSLERLPKPSKPLELDELGRELFARGIPNDAVDKVIAAIQRQRRLWDWYREHESKPPRPTEHEAVAHMVLPLLLALGWSEQWLAVDWRRVDLAVLRDDTCVLVCEAKRMGHGLQDVLPQPRRYAKHLRLADTAKILLTDGGRFYLYERIGNRWSDEPVGYLNVNRIRTSHLKPANTNAVDTIVALTPAGVMRRLSKEA